MGRLRAATVDGDVENGSLMAGQIAALVTKVEPARDIIQDIMRTAEEALQRIDAVRGPARRSR